MLRFCGFVLGAAVLFAADGPLKVDNDTVRILRAVDQPHHKGPLHRHAVNRVMIYLDAGDITLTYENGKKDEGHWKAGQVAWSPAGELHTSENVGAAPVRIIEIELKKAAPATPPIRRREVDPVAIDPKHNILLFENPQVRVFRSWREPGGTEAVHEHTGAGRAAVFLTDAVVKDSPGAEAVHHAAGDVAWSGPITHATINAGSSRLEMVVVEVK